MLPPGIKSLFIPDLTPDDPSFSLGRWQTPPGNGVEPSVPRHLPTNAPGGGGKISTDLEENRRWLRRRFEMPLSRGVIIRRMAIGAARVPALVCYMGGQVDVKHLSEVLFAPLLDPAIPEALARSPKQLLTILREGNPKVHADWDILINAMLHGSALLLIDGSADALAVELRGAPARPVERPQNEIIVRGPQDGFTEDIQTNIGLLRRRIRTPGLIIEWGQIGRISRTEIAVVYLKPVANKALVGEVRRRLSTIDIDYLGDSGTLEQLIEDRPYSLYPSMLSTERPDRVASQIADGFVAILVNNDPFALVAPATMPMFLQTPEDAYIRWPYGTFLRLVRNTAYLVALLLPGIYVAVANFHQEMIPTPLMLAISGSRETVPMPVVAEVLMMEAMFELIREAGIRVPTVIGPTIGIVGALIMGQAAVQAGVISPILVILTSGTALSSFAIPNYNLQFAARILRFGYIFAGAFLGLVGLMLLFMVVAFYQCAGNSFGVPWAAPLTPHRKRGDAIVRIPPFEQVRPETVRPQRKRKLPRATRIWTEARKQEEREQHDPNA